MSYDEEPLKDPLEDDDLQSLFAEPAPQPQPAEAETFEAETSPVPETHEDATVAAAGGEPDVPAAPKETAEAAPPDEMVSLMRDMKGLIEGVVSELSQLSGRVERLEEREITVAALPAAEAETEQRAIEEEADAIVAELEKIEQRIADIVAELAELSDRIDHARAELEGHETTHADAIRAVEDARRLAVTLPSAEAFAADAEAHAADLLQRIESQRSRLAEDERRSAELEHERASLEDRARELRGGDPAAEADAPELPAFQTEPAADGLPVFEPVSTAPAADELPSFEPVAPVEPELPSFEPAATEELPSFEPVEPELPSFEPAATEEIPAFEAELPSFESLSDIDAAATPVAPVAEELPSFDPVEPELPSFDPAAGEELPSFEPELDLGLPSFESLSDIDESASPVAPVAEELPAFEPVAEELPAFAPVVADDDPLGGLGSDSSDALPSFELGAESLSDLSAEEAPAWELPEPQAPAFGGAVGADELDFGSRDIVAPLIDEDDDATELAAPEPQSQNDELPEPVDLLWKVAALDPERTAAREEQATLSGLKTVAAASAGTQQKKRKKGDKPQYESLPFDVLAKTKPLIVTFFSPSGGSGKSSQAANFAAYVATVAQAQAFEEQLKTGKQDVYVPRVLLLDGDLVHGSLLARLAKNLAPEPNIQTLLDYVLGRGEAGFQGADRWPRSFENAAPGERAMTEFVHWPEEVPNLHVLAAPDDPYDFFKLYPEDFGEIIELLSQHYDVIVIDSGTEIVMHQTRAWLTHAHVVFAMVMPLIDRIHNARKVMKLITSHYPDPMDTNEQPQMLEPMIKRDSMGVALIGADATRGLGEPDELLEYAFGNTERDQRFKINDYREAMDNTINEGRFLVRESKDYAKEIAPLAKFAFELYSPSTKR